MVASNILSVQGGQIIACITFGEPMLAKAWYTQRLANLWSPKLCIRNVWQTYVRQSSVYVVFGEPMVAKALYTYVWRTSVRKMHVYVIFGEHLVANALYS